METSRNFERAIVARYNLTSDYQLAKLLGVKPSTISAHRTGDAKTFGEEIGYRIAELLDLPAEYVLSCLAAERSKDVKIKKVWARIADLTRVAVFAAVTLASSSFVTPPAQAAGAGLCILCKIIRQWLRRVTQLLGSAWPMSQPARPPQATRHASGCYPSFLGGIMRMRKILPALSLAALTACGSHSGPTNHDYGYHYDVAGASGLRVRYDGNPAPTLEQIEALFTETEACAGIQATGPLVIFVHDTFGENSVYGQTFLDTGTITISSYLNPDPQMSFWTYKHEFVHYLLHQSGFPIDQNAAHQSPLFADCTQPPAG